MKIALGLAAAVLAAGCGGEKSVPAAELGAKRFNDPGLSRSPLNAFSCATCHQVQAGLPAPSIVASHTGRIDPGYNLYDVVHRPTWWGGYKTTLLDAINYCLGEFMGGGSLAATDDSARELYEYFLANSPDNPSPAFPLTVVKNVTPLSSLTGNATTGKDRWDQSCRRCHGDPHTGNGRLSAKVSIVPEDTIAVFGSNARAVVVEKVRHGKFFNIGGLMAPYSAESISDQDIADILAYVGL